MNQISVTPQWLIANFGAFDSIEPLGSGTFGTTFKVQRGQEVWAIKVLHHGPNSPNYLIRREIESLSRIRHANVMGFRGSLKLSCGTTCLECEFVPGGTVTANLAKQPPRTPELVRAFLVGLLRGVDEMHKLGIVHRDLKPDNICLRNGNWAEPVILDFGMAKPADMSNHTAYPARKGTVIYMAPEQLRGEEAGPRSDLFAVGLIAYEVATGEHPFYEPWIQTIPELVGVIQRQQQPAPYPLHKHCPQDVSSVIQRLLSFQRHSRLPLSRALSDLGVQNHV